MSPQHLEMVNGTLDVMIGQTLGGNRSATWIPGETGTSDKDRKAKYDSITQAGQKRFVQGTSYSQGLAGVMGLVLGMQVQGGKH